MTVDPSFVGRIEDAFLLQGRVLLIVSGCDQPPKVGLSISIGSSRATVVAVDGKGVRRHDCLTGQPIVPQTSFLVDWCGHPPRPSELREEHVETI